MRRSHPPAEECASGLLLCTMGQGMCAWWIPLGYFVMDMGWHQLKKVYEARNLGYGWFERTLTVKDTK